MLQTMYKLIGRSAVEYNGQSITLDDMVYTRPSDEVLWAAGYRPIGASTIPDYDIETEMAKVDHFVMNDEGTEIVPVWVVEPLPELDDISVEPTIEERLDALEQAGLERDAALIELAAMVAGGIV